MKRRIVYRPQALADLDEVHDYTRRTWSRRQAKVYVRALTIDIKSLETAAFRHPSADPIMGELRRMRSAMHHIYYLVSAHEVEIVRILHVRRDPGRHLG